MKYSFMWCIKMKATNSTFSAIRYRIKLAGEFHNVNH